MSVIIPTPALSFVGRKNSGKTTLLEKLIAHLSAQGLNIATIKHHGHPDFDIDIPGKDSYRHRKAGARCSAVVSTARYAHVVELDSPLSCEDILSQFSNYDLALVEGFRHTNLDHIELLRKENPRDEAIAERYLSQLKDHMRSEGTTENSPSLPAGIVTNIRRVQETANELNIPYFNFNEIERLSAFVVDQFTRPALSVVVQAGGESKRMGQPKETALLCGQPLIEYVLERMAPLADELIVTTNYPERIAYLTSRFPNIQFVQDTLQTRGALTGLYTALQAAHNSLVSVVACDMIDVPNALIAQETLDLRPSAYHTHDVMLPFHLNTIEPFAAVYRRESCLCALKEFMSCSTATSGKQNSMQDYLQTLSCGFIDCSDPRRLREYGGSFLNINTPDDLARLNQAFSQTKHAIFDQE